MVEMSCEVHDQQAANTQFITHTVGRVLNEMNVSSTAINTRGYESLLNLVENTAHDSFDLYYGLFMYNQVRPRLGELKANRQSLSNTVSCLYACAHVARCLQD